MSPAKRSNRCPRSVTLDERFSRLDDADLYLTLHLEALERFDQEPKPLQLETVMSLVKRRHTFLLAGTGFGKTRIAEMYLSLFDHVQKPVVLVLNPLDSLGDNQVQYF